MFKIDLAKARQVEIEFVRKILKPWVLRVELNNDDEKHIERDVKVDYKDGTSKTFEIKDCPKAKEYGSIPFESECNWKPSGVFASKADYIVYHFNDTRYRQERGKLLHELIWINKYETLGWDNEKSKMYVVDNKIAELIFNKL